MALDLFDDVFLLYFAFEAPEGVFQGFTVLESDFCQFYDTSKPITDFTSARVPDAIPATARQGTDII